MITTQQNFTYYTHHAINTLLMTPTCVWTLSLNILIIIFLGKLISSPITYHPSKTRTQQNRPTQSELNRKSIDPIIDLVGRNHFWKPIVLVIVVLFLLCNLTLIETPFTVATLILQNHCPSQIWQDLHHLYGDHDQIWRDLVSLH